MNKNLINNKVKKLKSLLEINNNLQKNMVKLQKVNEKVSSLEEKKILSDMDSKIINL